MEKWKDSREQEIMTTTGNHRYAETDEQLVLGTGQHRLIYNHFTDVITNQKYGYTRLPNLMIAKCSS